MSASPAVNLGGDGSTAALAGASCATIASLWLNTKAVPLYVLVSGTPIVRFCSNGVDYGGDGSSAVCPCLHMFKTHAYHLF